MEKVGSYSYNPKDKIACETERTKAEGSLTDIKKRKASQST